MMRNQPKKIAKEIGTSDCTIKFYRIDISMDTFYIKNEINENSQIASITPSHVKPKMFDIGSGQRTFEKVSRKNWMTDFMETIENNPITHKYFPLVFDKDSTKSCKTQCKIGENESEFLEKSNSKMEHNLKNLNRLKTWRK